MQMRRDYTVICIISIKALNHRIYSHLHTCLKSYDVPQCSPLYPVEQEQTVSFSKNSHAAPFRQPPLSIMHGSMRTHETKSYDCSVYKTIENICTNTSDMKRFVYLFHSLRQYTLLSICSCMTCDSQHTLRCFGRGCSCIQAFLYREIHVQFTVYSLGLS